MSTREMTIAGILFTVSTPYAEGHVVNAAEAKTLNQTRCENISNAMRKKIDELKDGETITEENLKAARAMVAEYDAGYQFTLASAGGSSRSKDPLQKECESLARAAITAQLKAAGRKVSDVDKEALANKIAEVAEMPEIVKRAKANLKVRAEMANELAELSLPDAAPEAEPDH